MEIAGFGTVILKTRRSPDSDEYNMLVLNNVVHMPTTTCNGFSSGIWTALLEYRSITDFMGYADQLDKLRKKPAFYTVPHKGLAKLALTGDPKGKDYIGDAMVMSLSVRLAEDDMRALFDF